MIIIYNVHIPCVKKIKVLFILSCRVVFVTHLITEPDRPNNPFIIKSLIPLSAIHLTYIHTQTSSMNPSLDGAYAMTVAELHLGLSVTLLTISSLKIFVAVYEDDQGLAYTEDASKSNSRSGRLPTWRSSRHVKDPMLITVGCDEEPILLSSLAPSSKSRQSDLPSTGGEASGIIKSVQISVTRDSIELGDRGGTEASASAEL